VMDACVHADVPLDVDALIAEFLADAFRTSLQLPHMTTGQRKRARNIADQHPELTCESYGLGAERQLHLFKRASKAQVDCASLCEIPGVEAGTFIVKNTFVDDWVIAGEAYEPSEPIIFRSMPLQLPECATQSGLKELLRKLDLTPITDLPCKMEPTATQQEAIASPGRSTSASNSASSPSPSSPASSDRELLALPDDIQVRNTFIHIEGTPTDSRAIQSMPHGMFRQQLLEETVAIANCPAAAAAMPVPMALEGSKVAGPAPLGAHLMTPGTEVMIEGLTKSPAFNGLCGVVQSLDEETGRYNILLARPAGTSGHQWAKIKMDNLRLVLPPPPSRFAPSLVLNDSVLQSDGLSSLPSTPLWEHGFEALAPLKLTALV